MLNMKLFSVSPILKQVAENTQILKIAKFEIFYSSAYSSKTKRALLASGLHKLWYMLIS